jgi:sphingomyelin phosphodiesterase
MFIYINQTDPDGSLTWLVDQLWDAEKNGKVQYLNFFYCLNIALNLILICLFLKFVYILSHIPPGDKDCLESWSRNYYRIVIRFN